MKAVVVVDENVAHVRAFVPSEHDPIMLGYYHRDYPPDTRYCVMADDLAAASGDGNVEFKIKHFRAAATAAAAVLILVPVVAHAGSGGVESDAARTAVGEVWGVMTHLFHALQAWF